MLFGDAGSLRGSGEPFLYPIRNSGQFRLSRGQAVTVWASDNFHEPDIHEANRVKETRQKHPKVLKKADMLKPQKTDSVSVLLSFLSSYSLYMLQFNFPKAEHASLSFW